MNNGIMFKQMPGQVNINEAEGIVECFVAGIGNKDSVGDICAPGAFSASLRRRTPRVVWGHDWNQPIGKVLEIYEVPSSDSRLPKKMKDAGIGGLYARVQFNLKSERGREAFASISFFGLDQEWSIGYKTLDAVYDNARQANILKEVELYEVSPVLHGANQLTGTISIKADAAVMEPEVKKQPLKDPKGGLTAAGREYFKRTQGANLKPGVKGPADTPEKMRRKGSFLTRFFTNPSGPLVKDNGKPTRLALSAAAWGEPIPKNAEDAAELAAKGRRLLERYKNQKEKDAKGEDYDSDDMPATGMNKLLARAVANEMDAPVRLRTSDSNMVVFDIMRDGEKQTFRMAYHYDDGEFMFGRSERVQAETVYLPMGEAGPGHAYVGDEKSAEDELDLWIDDMVEFATSEDEFGSKSDEEAISAIAELISTDIQVKAGRVLSGSNMEKLQQAISILREIAAAGGREDIEMKTTDEFVIPAEQKNLFGLRIHLDPIFDHYGAKVLCQEDGIHIKSLTGNVSDFKAAINTALNGVDSPLVNKSSVQPEDIEEKALGRRGRRAVGRLGGRGGGGRKRGRRGLGGAGKKPSYDGDNDGFITNPLTGRDEIPWSRNRETPEEAVRRFFGGRQQRLPGMANRRPAPQGRPLTDKVRGVEARIGFDKLELGDVLPDNWDDVSKKLGSPRWQVTSLSRKPDGSYSMRVSDLSNGRSKDLVLPGTQQFPNVSRPVPTRVSRGLTQPDREGKPKITLDTVPLDDGNLPPFDINKRKRTAGPKPAKKKPEKTFDWPKNSNGEMKPTNELNNQELFDALNFWQNALRNNPNENVEKLVDDLLKETADRLITRRSEDDSRMPVPANAQSRNLPKPRLNLDWVMEPTLSLSGEDAVASVKTPNAEFSVVRAEEFDGTPGKYVIDGRFLVNSNGDKNKFNPDREFDSVEDAMLWAEEFDRAYDSGFTPFQDGFEWPGEEDGEQYFVDPRDIEYEDEDFGGSQDNDGWDMSGLPSPTFGEKSQAAFRGDNGEYYIIDAGTVNGTPGKFTIDGFYVSSFAGDRDYFNGYEEFDSVEEAMDWVMRFENAYDDGFTPEDEAFDWPVIRSQPTYEMSKKPWRTPVKNSVAKDADGTELGDKTRLHNKIPNSLLNAREMFKKKWLDRRKSRNISENIELADDRISELRLLAMRLDFEINDDNPGFSDAYSMRPSEFARIMMEDGLVNSLEDGLALYDEYQDLDVQKANDVWEIYRMIGVIEQERRRLVDKWNEKHETGNPDFPTYFDER